MMKKSCVSYASGAEPQMIAFKSAPTLVRIAGNMILFASASQRLSPIDALPSRFRIYPARAFVNTRVANPPRARIVS